MVVSRDHSMPQVTVATLRERERERERRQPKFKTLSDHGVHVALQKFQEVLSGQ